MWRGRQTMPAASKAGHNGENLRVSGYMKAYRDADETLRSVDLAAMTEAPAVTTK